MRDEVKQRLCKVTKTAGIVAIAGCLYAVFCSVTGHGIPCLIRLVTGYKCAGCGLTHMMIALMRLDFSAAFHANRFLFVLLPFLAADGVYHVVQYIRCGFVRVRKFENVLCAALVPALIAWSVIRNL